ncbi:head maturation protease, ClpP-related [Metabacillus bambusae]|uniref:ATP-dependent Clp protease proteolytic subunit n=1 Tax=Metabacillus bambusae TaxID=2795218 RepID=A0ABS3N4P6_9BACI|nr:head maturation protease, ClpP-related [Metabacillus bambusae]MBO1513255.1 Clp protease ClpP [Metabacillus bambusae]
MKHKIKGDITSWNSSIWDFNYKMRSIKEDEDIELEINSYGGDVFAGIDIMNSLRGHKGNVTITITGIAASAASVICMGADKIRMYSNTQLMVHNAWTVVAGNAKKLRKAAEDLESIGESVLASYTHRIDEDTAKNLLDKETYLSASKAVELGLVDEIVDADPETVESEVFKDEADKFNNKIVAFKQKSSTTIGEKDFNEMKQQFDEMKNELEKLKKNQKDEPESTPVVAKSRFIF